MTRLEEVLIKEKRLRTLIEAKGLDGILLKKQPNFSWLTGGGLNSDDVEGDLATALGDIAVYQVNHHASLTSSSERFLRTIQPEVAVISVGTNEYGHPT
jgi:beta-lactamase superfamily II metal-dependent hydrolase